MKRSWKTFEIFGNSPNSNPSSPLQVKTATPTRKSNLNVTKIFVESEQEENSVESLNENEIIKITGDKIQETQYDDGICKENKVEKLSFVEKNSRRITDDILIVSSPKSIQVKRTKISPKTTGGWKNFENLSENRLSTPKRWKNLNDSFSPVTRSILDNKKKKPLNDPGVNESLKQIKWKRFDFSSYLSNDNIVDPDVVDNTATSWNVSSDKSTSRPVLRQTNEDAKRGKFYKRAENSRPLKYKKHHKLMIQFETVLNDANSTKNFWNYDVDTGIIIPNKIATITNIQSIFGRIQVSFKMDKEDAEHIIYLDPSCKILLEIETGTKIAIEIDDPGRKVGEKFIHFGIVKIKKWE